MVGLPGRGGLPAGQALHPRWDPYHRPTAAEFMTARVQILRHSSDTTWDEPAGQTVFPPPAVVWEGWARIQRTQQMERPVSIGDRKVVLVGATVSIPVETPEVRIADEVRVLAFRDPNSGDPHLAGRPLWIHEIRPGSMLWQRDLVVLDAPPTTR